MRYCLLPSSSHPAATHWLGPSRRSALPTAPLLHRVPPRSHVLRPRLAVGSMHHTGPCGRTVDYAPPNSCTYQRGKQCARSRWFSLYFLSLSRPSHCRKLHVDSLPCRFTMYFPPELLMRGGFGNRRLKSMCKPALISPLNVVCGLLARTPAENTDDGLSSTCRMPSAPTASRWRRLGNASRHTRSTIAPAASTAGPWR